MRFGSWSVTESGITWAGDPLQQFEIPAEQLTRKINQLGHPASYEWILSATNEEWLTENDLYDLNYAFVFAAAKFGSDFSYEVFDATLEQQYDQFEDEEDEDE